MLNFRKKFLAIFCLVPCLSAVDDTSQQQGISSNFVNTVQVLLNKKDDVKLIENNLQLIQSGVDNIISMELVEINDLKGMQSVSDQAKEKIIEAKSSLQYIQKAFQEAIEISGNLNKTINTGIKTVSGLKQFLSGMGINFYPGMSEIEIRSLVHKKLTETKPYFDVVYSGSVNYTGSQNYSGKVDYNGNVYAGYQKWTCQNASCRGMNGWIDDHPIKYCSYCAKYWGDCGHLTANKESLVTENAYVNYSGSQSYSGNVSYSGSQNYSGKTNTSCDKDHHSCVCDKWSVMISGLYQALEEKEFYKDAFEKQKVLIENMGEKNEKALDFVKEVIPEFDSINDKGQLAISTIQSERQHFLSGLKDQKEKVAFAFNIMNQFHESENGFKDQLLNIVKVNEQEQRQEKIKLQEELRKMEESKSLQLQSIIDQGQSLTKEIIAQNNYKDNKLEEERRKQEQLKDEMRNKQIESVKLEVDLSNDKDAFINFLPTLLNSNVDEDKLQNFLVDIEEKNLSFKDLIREIKKFTLKKENKKQN